MFSLALMLMTGCNQEQAQTEEPAVWTAEQAHEWYARQDWIVGCNYTPYNQDEIDLIRSLTLNESIK